MVHKKSQMEIMGLAMMVILVVIGVLLTIKFIMMKAPDDIRSTQTQSQLSSNLLNTILKTTAEDCNQRSMTDLIKDCRVSQLVTCNNGQNSCDYIQENIEYLLNNTVGEWYYNYEFNISDTDVGIIGGGCSGSSSVESEFQPIKAEGIDIQVILRVCTVV